MTVRRKLRFLVHAFVAVLPVGLKRLCYRYLFRFQVGRDVRVGITILDVDRCVLGDAIRIGHFNVFTQVEQLDIGDHVRIGFGNLLRGGSRIVLGRYSEILRLNRINSIPDAECIGLPDPVFVLGEGSVITSEHRFDFTDRIEVGRFAVIGGRNSSFWTHNRQATEKIRIGSFAYIGSEVRFAPGAAIPSWSILGLGSVVVAAIESEGCLIAGVPAKVIRPLSNEDLSLIGRKTRKDIPDALYDDVVGRGPTATALPGRVQAHV
jgi:acetyltransferase-like isoleucine patch superfamily enzyme